MALLGGQRSGTVAVSMPATVSATPEPVVHCTCGRTVFFDRRDGMWHHVTPQKHPLVTTKAREEMRWKRWRSGNA